MAEEATSGRGILGRYFATSLMMRIFVALISGAAVGALLGGMYQDLVPGYIEYTKFFGDVFIQLLRMIVVPTIFFSLIVGSSSISPAQLGKIGLKTALYYLVTSVICIGIALVIANVFQPGLGLNITEDAGATVRELKAPSLAEVLLAIIPANPVMSLARGDVLSVIFFALVFGIALAMLRDRKSSEIAAHADTLRHMIIAITEAVLQIVRGVMQYAPIGVFVLISNVFALQGPKVLGPLLHALALVYLGLFLHMVIGYGGLLKLFGLSFITFIKGSRESLITAFVTRSSAATLPVNMRVCEENLGIPRSISSFALPVGATVNMDGTAIYLTIGTFFIANAVGAPLTLEMQLTIMLVATLGAIGTAGIPSGGAIMMLMVLESVDLPVTAGSAVAVAYAMILGIDPLFDMGRTCLNIAGDVVGVGIVAKSEHQLDRSKW